MAPTPFHFPDGNASIARLLVRALVPAAVPGRDCEDVVTARVDYGRLDRADNPVRIRLSSLCARARNIGGADASRGVEVAYVRGDRLYRVTGKACILASWNMMIPYLCPRTSRNAEGGLAQDRQDAAGLHQRRPCETGPRFSVWVSPRSPRQAAITPNFRLNWPVDIGGYDAERSPEKPILVHMTRTPCKPGPVRIRPEPRRPS